MHFDQWMEVVVRGFEAVGVIILAIGSIWALVSAWPLLRHNGAVTAYTHARQMIGRSILLGLEILIIADIVKTITIDATLESAFTLGLIVLVRTFLSFSLEIELDGIVPWRRHELEKGEKVD
jgi:uncharacterized membrane protein